VKLTRSAPLFAALADETRLGIVVRLCERGPSSIASLTDGTNVSRQAVTKHLHALAGAGLVRSARAGRERIWALETKRLAEAGRYLEQISRQWDAALLRLKALVEQDG
jgi:DNA-binding transcriptional ArsR family regulator